MESQTAAKMNRGRFAGFFSIRGSRWVIGTTALMVLVAGLWVAGKAGEATDLQMRHRLMRQAGDVAAGINITHIRALSFTADDKDRPIFRRMCEQMRAYAEATGLTSLYTMALHDGQIVFGPESLSEGHRYASPPGTVYQMPTALDFEIFRTGQPQIQGPARDEYGTFVRASAPISDPDTGEVVTAVGLDVEAAAWQAAVRKAQWIPVWVTIVLLFILLLSDLILEYLHKNPGRRSRQRRHAETYLCFIFMSLLTLALAVQVDQTEREARRSTFDSLAHFQVISSAEKIYGLRGMLNELRYYFESSRYVTRDEFKLYCDAMGRKSMVDAFIWMPAVPEEEADSFTQEVWINDEVPDFSIWQRNNEGLNEPASPRPVYYPAFYVEPMSGYQSIIGYDLNSEPQRSAAIQEALKTGLAVASEPIQFITATNAAKGLLIFVPVNAQFQKGLAALAIHSERLLGASAKKNAYINICLFQLKEGRGPLFLAGSGGQCGLPCWDDKDYGLRITIPVFRFGKAYALRAVPGPDWMKAHSLHNGRAAFVVGLLLTLLVTSLTMLITNRRVVLEERVERRTAELKRAEKNLDRLNRQNRLILSSTAEGILGLDSRGNHTFVNPSAAKMLGYDIEELIGRPSHSLWHHTKADGTHYPEEECGIHASCKDGRGHHASDEVFWRKDGTSFPVEYNSAPVYEQGQAAGAVVTFTDITERKQAEAALKSSEERFRDIVQNTSDWLWEMDAQGVLRYVSEKSTGLLGYTPEELIGTTLYSRMHAKQAEEAKAFYAERVKDRAPFRDYENWIVRKDGTPVCMLRSGIPMFSKDGTFIGFRGTDTDITVRKWYEQDIKQSMSLLEATLDATADGILVVDGTGKILRFNQRFLEMWRIPKEIIAQGSDEAALNFVLEQICEPEQFLAKVRELYRSPKDKSFDILHFHDGRVFERYSQPQRVSDDVIGRVWSFHDVTKREQAEALLWASQTKLDLALQSALMGVWQWDVVTDKRTYDRQTCIFLGINPGTFGGTEEEFLAVLHPDDREKVKKALIRTVEEHAPYDVEYRVIWPDGSLRHIATRAHLFLDDGDQQLKVTGVCWDITDRKQAEVELREAKAVLQAAMDNSPAGIAVADASDGKLRYVNKAALSIRGGTHEEVVAGVGLDQYVASWKMFELDGVTPLPPADAPLIRAIRYGKTTQREFIIRRADGDDRIVFANAAPITDVQGNVSAAIVVFLDITDRRKAEERIHQLAQYLETVREEERKRISRELHDDIGQIFTALKIDLAGMKDGFPGEDDTKERMDDIQKLLSDGIQSVHSLCRQLRPGALDDLSLEDALEGLLDDWKYRNQVECNLCADVDDEALSDEIRTAVFRMAQEALTNVSRYAQASEVEINLVADEKTLNVSITDNGRGMEPGAADKPTSFGLLGMRERIEAIGGTLCIESAPGKGTQIEATIPLTQNEKPEID
jgi:PAS domain S-box-containing protein